jgi:serine/threonine protein kinase
MDWEAFYARFREPDFIRGYEIQNRLGGGAFGEVYKARKHSIGKSYAIKFLKIDDDAQREAVERELDQVRHFAALDHPNLVTIEDLGTAMGVPYLIMGYAGEDTLARVMKRERLTEERALVYFIQASRGVLALHDLRLLHFDLKPSNVFIKGDVARVGDYGLSKMMTDGKLTLSFGRGTPQYMAPEMIRNRADHRADIYSLGVILFESLSGRLPFDVASSGTLAIREDDRPPAFPPEFPARCRGVVERCLRLSPEHRYANVAEMLEELGARARSLDSVLLAGEPRHPAPPPILAPLDLAPRSEARHAARELTRGAVEVARGVLDGIRAASRSRPPTSATPTPVLPPPVPSAGVPALAAKPRSEDAFAMQTLSEGDAAHAARAAQRVEVRPVATTPVAAAAKTIPVPPPAEGGVLKTFWATVLLAFEVLVALVRGVMRHAARTITGPRATGVRRTTGRVVAASLRLALFLFVLAVLGGVFTLAAVYFASHGKP